MADLCASFQRAVVDALLTRTFEAAGWFGAKSIGIAGGVSANSRLRADAMARGEAAGIPVFVPALSLTTDNAAMIAAAGLRRAARRRHRGLGRQRPRQPADTLRLRPWITRGPSGPSSRRRRGRHRRRPCAADPPRPRRRTRGSGRFPAGQWSSASRSTPRLRREVREETGLEIAVGPLLEIYERVERDADGAVRFHFVGHRLSRHGRRRRAPRRRRRGRGGLRRRVRSRSLRARRQHPPRHRRACYCKCSELAPSRSTFRQAK